MINKIFSNSERVKEPAGSAGRGVARVRGVRGQGKRGRWWGGRGVAGCGALPFLAAQEKQELIQAFGEGPNHVASQQGGKSSFLKQVMQLFDLKALRGEEKG